MTEHFIRAVAQRYGLTVLRRITTGTPTRGFATFELTGPAEKVVAAWPTISERGRDEKRSRDFDRMTMTDDHHPEAGQPFIECSSVWIDDSARGVNATVLVRR